MHSACGGCGHGYRRGGYYLVKVILKLIIVIIIFCIGFKLGILTGELRGAYGHGAIERNSWKMMGGYGYNYTNNPQGSGSGTQATTK